LKLLLDTCVWGGAVESLRESGHDVFWCGELSPDPGDEVILRRAVQEKRVLVTLDKDFGELVFLRGQSHTGIIRLVEVPSLNQAEAIQAIVSKQGEELTQGAIITLKNNKLRIRKQLIRD
jgi:predicted nuclease of predicted toxin-antitoxin system